MQLCLYCLKPIKKVKLSSLILKEDELCLKCRNGLAAKLRKSKINDLTVHYLYEYNDTSLYKEMLLQYKELYDEALYSVFLYPYLDLIKFIYHGYKICLIPSTSENIKRRGFDHLKLIIKDLNMPTVSLGLRKELSQKGKSSKEREKMIGNYYLKSEIKAGDKILIFDDVLTTGASLSAALEVFERKVKKIKVFVLGLVIMKNVPRLKR